MALKPLFSIFPNSTNPPLTSAKPHHLNIGLSRRDFINVGLSVMPLLISPPPLSIAREVEVGSFLPPSPTDPNFVLFKATPKDTPALRAGIYREKQVPSSFEKIVCSQKVGKQHNVSVKLVKNLRCDNRLTGNVQPYTFILPPTWKQLRIANILSGNYCQPKCAEPWVEVKFEDEKQGKVQVVASPLIRLTNKPNATIEDIGTPEKVIASLGPFVTGNTLDLDELLDTSIEKRGDLTYYKYVLETPYALTGSHNLAKATAKGNTVVLCVVSANDKQWASSQKTLQAILDSFEV